MGGVPVRSSLEPKPQLGPREGAVAVENGRGVAGGTFVLGLPAGDLVDQREPASVNSSAVS